MRRPGPRLRIACCLTSVGFVLAGSRNGGPARVDTLADLAGALRGAPALSLPECPKYGVWSEAFKNGLGIVTALPVTSGRITDIPEFHDCQRFIQYTGGKASYLPLFAIFARDSLRDLTRWLDTIPDSSERKNDSHTARGHVPSIGVGVVLALDADYPKLGIRRGYNCLFIYGAPATSSGLAATMLPVGKTDSACVRPFVPRKGVGTLLEVKRTHFKAGEVPGVARWDWDSVHRTQHVGIACGSAWCDVGAKGFAASAAHATANGNFAHDIVAIKGWYDEQRLAVPGTKPYPGAVIGTIIPAPDLGNAKMAPGPGDAYWNKWVPVASVGMTIRDADYQKKFNLEQSPIPPATNIVSLCHSPDKTCDTTPSTRLPACPAGVASEWWLKVVSGTKPAMAKYFCVNRRGHESIPGLDIPGIVRWRWAVKDETMWIRCLEGCCEAEAGSGSAISIASALGFPVSGNSRSGRHRVAAYTADTAVTPLTRSARQ